MAPEQGSLLPRHAYTMIQWMAMVCVLAILSASVPLIYRFFMARAYEEEAIQVLCRLKLIQDDYFAKNHRYAGGNKLQSVPDVPGLMMTNTALQETQSLKLDDVYLSVNHPKSDEYLFICLPPEEGRTAKLQVERIAIDHKGNIYRSGKGRTDNWRPEYPHLRSP